MREVDLLDTYPRIKRPIKERAQWKARSEQSRAIAKRFGREYFDGTRDEGYGGYYYDGRWEAVAKRMIEHYGLTGNESILDVGSGKGFLLHDFLELMPGLKVAGLEISSYGVEHAMEDVKPHVLQGNAKDLPFKDDCFDLVISINVVHNLVEEECRRAIREMERASRKFKYVQVDSFRNQEEKENLEKWQLTAELIYSTDQWKELFREEGYTGDFYWTITE
ncbi:MAG: class I SAM-dependent methyltransferase [Nitrospinota bacterium]